MRVCTWKQVELLVVQVANLNKTSDTVFTESAKELLKNTI